MAEAGPGVIAIGTAVFDDGRRITPDIRVHDRECDRSPSS